MTIGRKKMRKIRRIKRKKSAFRTKLGRFFKKIDIRKSLKRWVTQSIKFLKRMFTVLIATIVFLTSVNWTIDTVHNYQINAAATGVVKLTPVNNHTTGGTGFVMVTPQGPRTVTNAHICGDSEALVAHLSERPVQILRVLKKDQISDLCILEPVNGVRPLTLGDAPERGEFGVAIGHPKLAPLTRSSGQILGLEQIQIAAGLYDPATCNGPTQSPQTFHFLTLCMVSAIAYTSNIKVAGGSSGSPVVNRAGKVIAVVFAGSNVTGNGYLVTHFDLVRFINEL